MGFDKIRGVILDEAKAEAAHIIEGAKRSAEQHVREACARIDDEMERTYRTRVQAIDDEFNRSQIQFKGNAGKQVLARRGEILHKVFAMARGDLLTMPSSEYGAIMGRLLERSAGKSGGRLRIHPEDTEVFTAILAGMNESRDAADQVVLDGEHPLTERGGFVLVTAEFEIDQTLDTLLRDLEQEMTPVIAGELFA